MGKTLENIKRQKKIKGGEKIGKKHYKIQIKKTPRKKWTTAKITYYGMNIKNKFKNKTQAKHQYWKLKQLSIKKGKKSILRKKIYDVRLKQFKK